MNNFLETQSNDIILLKMYNKSMNLVTVSAQERCLRFAYHMYGSTLGFLAVYYQGSNVGQTLAFLNNRNQGNQWIPVEIEIPVVRNLQVKHFKTLFFNFKIGEINMYSFCVFSVVFIPLQNISFIWIRH